VSLDARLSRLAPALSARERALLVLRSMKDKTPEDPLWRNTMPNDQVREFNRLIDLMNAANREMAFLIAMIEKEMEKLELRAAWLFSLYLWRLNLADINFTAPLVTREAITRSEHEKLVAEAADDYLLVSQLAVVLAEEKRTWSDDDVEAVGWTRELVLKPQAWKSIVAKAEHQIREAVDAGNLEARGAGRKLAVKRAAFDAWLGRPVTLYPEWAGAYEVLPDERAVHVEADRHTLKHLRQAIEETPLPGDVLQHVQGSNLDAFIDAMEERLEQGLLMRWEEVVAAERVVDQIAAEFDGEDPLKPRSRAGLQRARELGEKLAQELGAMGRPVELANDADDEVRELRLMLERKGCVFRLVS
jgi:hypothetical protein